MLPAYADEHVDMRIVDGLRRHGVDVVTAQERGQRNTDDTVLLQTATNEHRLMLSNDTDFLRIHHEWMVAGRNHGGILFWPQTRPIGQAIRRILDYSSHRSPADAVNDLQYLQFTPRCSN